MDIRSVTLDDPMVQKISEGLDRHGEQYNVPSFDPKPFAFIASDMTHDFLGGAKGKISAGWCSLSWLYSTQEVQGTGSALMERIEKLAKEHNCKGILVDTLSYQAPDFYKKFGFEVYGKIPNFISNQTRLFFVKRF